MISFRFMFRNKYIIELGSNMSILITGGMGYIGSHTSLKLIEEGYDIVLIDNQSNSHMNCLTRLEELSGKKLVMYSSDLKRPEQLEQIFSDHKIDAVIHFAGYKAVGESVRIPLFYYHNNLSGTINLCQVMQKYNVKKLVFSSSATVYAPTDSGAISEDFPLGASNPYGRTKLMIEDMLRDLYASDHEWSISLLRYFNPVGAHPSGRIGEDPSGIPNNLMPYITQVAVGKLKNLHVFGNDYPTPDGTGVRDYIHVEDLARGHLKAIEKVMRSQGIDAYNLGTGRGHSVLEMIQAFERASGIHIPYTIVDRRQGDVAVCYADPSKAKRKLGWVAEKGIDEMCADAWRWQRNNPNGYDEVLNEPVNQTLNI